MKRLVSALAVGCLLLGLAPTALAAGPTRHFERVDRNLDKIDVSFRPFLADKQRKMTVMLELAARPAVELTGSDADRKAEAKTLRATQARLGARIEAIGGKVLHRYQYVYNGIKVRATGAQVKRLAAMRGVVSVQRIATYKPTNVNAIPYVGAPSVWQNGAGNGAGETVAIIDTGIDYTHANFGGPGTTEAYDDNDSTIIEDGTFPTAKVIDGYDFAGDGYDAEGDEGSVTPAPDPDPLDCYGHGSHVAGTAAGQGVLADHSTYPGPYNSSTLSDPDLFGIGPGVAPEASLIALKVFGCAGSSDLIVDAMEWVAGYNVSHVHGIGVVNMSLGSVFGRSGEPDVIATDNLVSMGVVVVASAGNENDVPFITGSPAAATKAISVAALDAFPTLPMATVDLPTDPDISGNNQNAFPDLPVSGTLHAVPNGTGGLSLGCTADDYDAGSAGKIVAIKRGVCAFVDKGAAAVEAGAIGIIMVNRDDTDPGALPTFIGFSPDEFDIPMVGVDKLAQPSLIANDGAAITLASAGNIANPTYKQVADFSSSGPRYGDNWLKPDVAAPGVSMISTLNGSGWNGTTLSGTSMAAPVTAGTAALVRAAHPGWSPLQVKAAIVNTADASSAKVHGYTPLRSGSGVVQANKAVKTVGLATTNQGTASLSFGYEPSRSDYRESKTITLWNTSSHPITYRLRASSSLVSISPTSVTVKPHDSRNVRVTASLSKHALASLPSADQFVTGAFGVLTSMSGAVTATPTSGGAGVYPLRVAYLLVPRGLSDVDVTYVRHATTGATLRGALKLANHGGHRGFADLYALGSTDSAGDSATSFDLRATGIQSIPAEALTGVPDPDDRSILFAVNGWNRMTSASTHEIDLAVDVDSDDVPDFWVIGIDGGKLFADIFDGVYISAIFDADFNLLDAWNADAPLNGSTVLLPALASDIGLTAGAGTIRYWVESFDLVTGDTDAIGASMPFDVFDPAQSTGDFVAVKSHDKAKIKVSADKLAIASGDVQGWLVVTLDDKNGRAQANIVRP